MHSTHTSTSSEKVAQLYAAVLAGGLSSRMGCDKRFLEIDGEPMVERALRLARGAIGGRADHVFLCGKVPGYSSLPDPVSGLGPIGGLVSGLRAVPAGTSGLFSWLLVMPVDMPLLTTQLLARLVAEIPKAEKLSAIGYQGYELPFVLRCDIRVRTALDQICLEPSPSHRSLRALLEQFEVRRLRLDDSAKKEMLNANSPNDWAEMGEGVSP